MVSLGNFKSQSKYVSLNNYIEFGKCEALNTQGNFGLKETFGYGGTMKSNEGDPEIIVKITFKEKLSCTGIMIEGLDGETCPKKLKIFSGNFNIDFSDLDSIKATEELTVVSGKIISLKLAKYRNIDCLALFLSNEEADLLKINSIQIFGEGGENTDMSQVKNTNP